VQNIFMIFVINTHAALLGAKQCMALIHVVMIELILLVHFNDLYFS